MIALLIPIQANTEAAVSDVANALPIGFAVAAGVVASVNPCGFFMLPSYIAFQLGTEEEGFETRHPLIRVGRALLVGGMATLGFVLIFAAVGAIVAAGGNFLGRVFPFLGLALGVLMVGFGIYLLASCHIGSWASWPPPGFRSPRAAACTGNAFVFGLGYAVGSLSCTLPIFLVVIGGSLATEGFFASFGQFVAYALGMGVVVGRMAAARAPRPWGPRCCSGTPWRAGCAAPSRTCTAGASSFFMLGRSRRLSHLLLGVLRRPQPAAPWRPRAECGAAPIIVPVDVGRRMPTRPDSSAYLEAGDGEVEATPRRAHRAGAEASPSARSIFRMTALRPTLPAGGRSISIDIGQRRERRRRISWPPDRRRPSAPRPNDRGKGRGRWWVRPFNPTASAPPPTPRAGGRSTSDRPARRAKRCVVAESPRAAYRASPSPGPTPSFARPRAPRSG